MDPSKDLEAYLQLRSSQDTLKAALNGGVVKYNFRDIDERQSASPPQRMIAERDRKVSKSPSRKSVDIQLVKDRTNSSSRQSSTMNPGSESQSRQNLHKMSSKAKLAIPVTNH